jgi:hypothetical protein
LNLRDTAWKASFSSWTEAGIITFLVFNLPIPRMRLCQDSKRAETLSLNIYLHGLNVCIRILTLDDQTNLFFGQMATSTNDMPMTIKNAYVSPLVSCGASCSLINYRNSFDVKMRRSPFWPWNCARIEFSVSESKGSARLEFCLS